MRQNRRIAVTGGIGSGKSTVCSLLRTWGYPVFSCDEIFHALREETEYLKGLKQLFPHAFRGEALDHRALADHVFSHADALERLNAYAHPAIMKRLFQHMDAYDIAFAEVPLLYEGGWDREFDGVIAVLRPQQERIAAVMTRDGLSRQEVTMRMQGQLDEALLRQKDCVLLYNHGSRDDLAHGLRLALARLQIIANP